MEKNLIRYEPNKLMEHIQNLPDLTTVEKSEFIKRILSDDADLRKSAIEKITQSQIALADLIGVQSEISALNKQGMYIKAKQTITTGSGHLEIEMKGGDTKLIIPVMVIAAIVVIAIAIVFFLK